MKLALVFLTLTSDSYSYIKFSLLPLEEIFLLGAIDIRYLYFIIVIFVILPTKDDTVTHEKKKNRRVVDRFFIVEGVKNECYVGNILAGA